MILRYAIWAAVSTKVQAAGDKVSIPEQIKRCQQEGQTRRWNETAGPFIVSGNSRTKYVDLSIAERDMPALKEMLDAAQAREFDVLLVYDLNRFRDLLEPIFRTLGGYRVQLYSLSQPVEPTEPLTYKWHSSDTMRIVVMMSQLTSQTENSTIRRRYEMGMPARVESGLPATSPPFGYTKPEGRKSIPVQNELAHVVIQMKDEFLSGHSLRQVVELLESQHIPTPRGKQWYPQSVKAIITNPFYAGYVRWGVSQVEHDLREGRRIRNRKIPEDQITTVRGKHKPLWDDATYQAIQDELSRRARNYRGRKNNQFTGLLKCSVCGESLWLQGNGPRGDDRRIWRCSSTKAAVGHVNVPHLEAVELIGVELVSAIQNHVPEDRPVTEKAESGIPLTDLQAQLSRLEDAYQVGAMPLDSLIERSNEVKKQIKKIQDKNRAAKYGQQRREQWLQAFGNAKERAVRIPNWLKEDDPIQVNRTLHFLLDSIVVHPDEEIEIHFKE